VAANGKPFARFNVVEWMCELISVADISIHWNELISSARKKSVKPMFCHIRTLKIKLHL
jgi:hypothetical protein